MKKYPITWLLVIAAANIFGGSSIWRFVDYFSKSDTKMFNPIFGIYLGVSSLIFMFVLIKFCDKLGKKEEKTRKKNFINKIKQGKPIVLVVKRRIFANFSLIFSVMAIWVFFLIAFPSKQFGGLGYTIVRILSLLWFIYGLLFSLFIPKKFLEFKNGRFYISYKDTLIDIAPHELMGLKLVKNPKYDNVHPSKTISVLLLADIEIELIDGQKIFLQKADRVFSLMQKIKTIQKLYEKDKTKTNKQTTD